ncbi:D-alanyl-D-alanine carboxypeptidase/D-alanyl-D-alanine-endopeptidase [Spirulina sp. 06S082]|uniref:D-alanyl-D-alanine carboxypeptidase/D-alanyl-D-alanine endopeptidase n=1 Tax=Spirulina sp. 06S082 TaxID=3110248 RepID=UPI002B1F33F5|nr:D-alanyl-D-alanine carboxypeptidase/D-alanyl-D-alanine-endopeptidase [Spirulina sp. 06S082]MEA5471967.1 D-alanyl-D-alanine carboxypeptidase/D-alanyl-D-alanine-endopeptidase [Spirulina sp. 06S082]
MRQKRLASLASLTVLMVAAIAPMGNLRAETFAEASETETSIAQSVAVGICPNQLQQAIDGVIRNPTFSGAKWGIHVETLNEGRVLYTHGTNQYLIPASNIKILTTAAALQLYDPLSPIRSSNLESWVRTILQRSNNDYADALLRGIGGTQAVRSALGRLGVSSDYRQADGSGLSRNNLVTPSALVDILKAIVQRGHGKEVFYASLPVAGRSGTLAGRFQSTPAQGIVHAKTGTLNGVRALSGYLEHPEYGVLVFSILVNQPGQSGQRLLNAIDNIVVRMASMNSVSCSRPF